MHSFTKRTFTFRIFVRRQQFKSVMIGLLMGCAALAQTKGPVNSPTVPKQGPTPQPASQPFGLKGDVLGESIQDFRAKNDRTISVGVMGRDRAKLIPDFVATKHLPQCTSDGAANDTNLSLALDVRGDFETAKKNALA